MDLHLARVQQRWRYADDELAPGETLNLDALAHDVSLLPDNLEGPPEQVAESMVDFFRQGLASAAAPNDDEGGSIEPADLDPAETKPEQEAAEVETAPVSLNLDLLETTGDRP
jgi:type IV secretion system protein VirD4